MQTALRNNDVEGVKALLNQYAFYDLTEEDWMGAILHRNPEMLQRFFANLPPGEEPPGDLLMQIVKTPRTEFGGWANKRRVLDFFVPLKEGYLLSYFRPVAEMSDVEMWWYFWGSASGGLARSGSVYIYIPIIHGQKASFLRKMLNDARIPPPGSAIIGLAFENAVVDRNVEKLEFLMSQFRFPLMGTPDMDRFFTRVTNLEFVVELFRAFDKYGSIQRPQSPFNIREYVAMLFDRMQAEPQLQNNPANFANMREILNVPIVQQAFNPTFMNHMKTVLGISAQDESTGSAQRQDWSRI